MMSKETCKCLWRAILFVSGICVLVLVLYLYFGDGCMKSGLVMKIFFSVILLLFVAICVALIVLIWSCNGSLSQCDYNTIVTKNKIQTSSKFIIARKNSSTNSKVHNHTIITTNELHSIIEEFSDGDTLYIRSKKLKLSKKDLAKLQEKSLGNGLTIIYDKNCIELKTESKDNSNGGKAK